MRLKDAGDYLVYLVVRLLICLVQALRIETCAAVAGWLAWLIGRVIRPRDEVIDENLRLAFPEMSAGERRRLTRRMWEHLLLMAIEAAHAPRKIHDTNWRQYIHLKDMRQMMRLFFADRPSVAVSAHFGNFELAAFAMRLFGLETFAVARPLDNRFLDRFIARFRSASVSRLLPKNGRPPRKSPNCWPGGECCRCWPINMRGRRVAGSISSAAPPRRTRQSPCSRWPTKRR